MIGCYQFEGRGNFSVAIEKCNKTGGYLVGIGSELEDRAVAGK